MCKRKNCNWLTTMQIGKTAGQFQGTKKKLAVLRKLFKFNIITLNPPSINSCL